MIQGRVMTIVVVALALVSTVFAGEKKGPKPDDYEDDLVAFMDNMGKNAEAFIAAVEEGELEGFKALLSKEMAQDESLSGLIDSLRKAKIREDGLSYRYFYNTERSPCEKPIEWVGGTYTTNRYIGYQLTLNMKRVGEAVEVTGIELAKDEDLFTWTNIDMAGECGDIIRVEVQHKKEIDGKKIRESKGCLIRKISNELDEKPVADERDATKETGGLPGEPDYLRIKRYLGTCLDDRFAVAHIKIIREGDDRAKE